MNLTFESVGHLLDWLTEHGKFELVSEPRKLTQRDINLFSLATGDFNPAHTQPGFASESHFGGIVSHGIATIARSEAVFVDLSAKMFPTMPTEIVARKGEFEYPSPLYCGEIYRFRFELSRLRFIPDKERWDVDCHMTCEVLGKNPRVAARSFWKPSIKEHACTPRNLKMLRPRSWRRNVFRVFVQRPLAVGCEYSFYCLVVFLLVASYALPILKIAGIIDMNELDYGAWYTT